MIFEPEVAYGDLPYYPDCYQPAEHVIRVAALRAVRGLPLVERVRAGEHFEAIATSLCVAEPGDELAVHTPAGKVLVTR